MPHPRHSARASRGNYQFLFSGQSHEFATLHYRKRGEVLVRLDDNPERKMNIVRTWGQMQKEVEPVVYDNTVFKVDWYNDIFVGVKEVTKIATFPKLLKRLKPPIGSGLPVTQLEQNIVSLGSNIDSFKGLTSFCLTLDKHCIQPQPEFEQVEAEGASFDENIAMQQPAFDKVLQAMKATDFGSRTRIDLHFYETILGYSWPTRSGGASHNALLQRLDG